MTGFNPTLSPIVLSSFSSLLGYLGKPFENFYFFKYKILLDLSIDKIKDKKSFIHPFIDINFIQSMYLFYIKNRSFFFGNLFWSRIDSESIDQSFFCFVFRIDKIQPFLKFNPLLLPRKMGVYLVRKTLKIRICYIRIKSTIQSRQSRQFHKNHFSSVQFLFFIFIKTNEWRQFVCLSVCVFDC